MAWIHLWIPCQGRSRKPCCSGMDLTYLVGGVLILPMITLLCVLSRPDPRCLVGVVWISPMITLLGVLSRPDARHLVGVVWISPMITFLCVCPDQIPDTLLGWYRSHLRPHGSLVKAMVIIIKVLTGCLERWIHENTVFEKENKTQMDANTTYNKMKCIATIYNVCKPDEHVLQNFWNILKNSYMWGICLVH